ncbi:hypothetical protein [Candidatus Williamhamiltonella defendens]|uniref:Uncharacterized protein n=1 Tax=Candidatus Williamhamiltonella defendens TaxID=138072 RepID=A0A2D3TDH9_9ENTR|nr:hypothetical protein [Candidatus Hamiltonella defensa]ATW33773.1 hypothetical protein BJP43_05220 [Candidatus Hamiltonella defensa]
MPKAPEPKPEAPVPPSAPKEKGAVLTPVSGETETKKVPLIGYFLRQKMYLAQIGPCLIFPQSPLQQPRFYRCLQWAR